jgi:hypothetical protein
MTKLVLALALLGACVIDPELGELDDAVHVDDSDAADDIEHVHLPHPPKAFESATYTSGCYSTGGTQWCRDPYNGKWCSPAPSTSAWHRGELKPIHSHCN